MDDMRAADFEPWVAEYAKSKGITAEAVWRALASYDQFKARP